MPDPRIVSIGEKDGMAVLYVSRGLKSGKLDEIRLDVQGATDLIRRLADYVHDHAI